MEIRHILLSSGTLASLTGRKKFDEVDEVQNRWVEFELASPTDTIHDWHISWERFTQANPDIVITKH